MLKKILVVDDEPRLRKLISDFLKREGYSVLEAVDGKEALEIFYSQSKLDLVILDVMMPEYDGWAVCREIRKTSDIRIIMLTARGEESDELFGFELGVDEYVKKPFSPGILMARVKTVLKRGAGNAVTPFRREPGVLQINRPAHYFSLKENRLELSPKEYELLLYLYDNRGNALSRGQILDSVWGYDCGTETRTVDTHVKKLRKKMGLFGSCIQTVRNYGYRLEIPR